jgi:hypothetical protein
MTTTAPALGGVGRKTTERGAGSGHRLHLRLGRPCEQDRASGRREELFDYRRTVLRCLSGSVDGLRHAQAQVAVVVHPGEPQVRIGKAPQLPNGVVGRAAPPGNVVDERAKRGSVHDLLYPAQL